MLKSIKLVLKEGTTFDLYFLNGTVKRYDILSLADKFPQLNALKDRNLFLKGKLLGWSGVYWNDELDIECDTVYEEGMDVSKEYDDVDNVVLGYKIREAQTKKIPYQLVIGDKEANLETITYRRHGEQNQVSVSYSEFINMINDEIKNKK